MTTSQTTNNNGEINDLVITPDESENKSQPENKRLRFGDVFLLLFGHTAITIIILVFVMIAAKIYTENISPKKIPITYLHTNQIITDGTAGGGIKITVGDKELQPVYEFPESRDFYFGNPDELSNSKITIEPQPKPNKTTDHFIGQLLSNDKRPLTILIAFICVVISAPLIEEFLYRGVLTGWLTESAKIYLPQLGFENKTSIASTIVALVFPALYFAWLHAGEHKFEDDALLPMIIAMSLANFIMLFVGIFYLTKVRNFTPDQIGLQMDKMRFDILVAIAISILAIPPLFALTNYCKLMFPDNVIDPIPIFFLAILLGSIFIITRRILPCIIIHALLNTVSFMVIIIYGA
jgi:membrane protease YdiL (CAAX protease family)